MLGLLLYQLLADAQKPWLAASTLSKWTVAVDRRSGTSQWNVEVERRSGSSQWIVEVEKFAQSHFSSLRLCHGAWTVRGLAKRPALAFACDRCRRRVAVVSPTLPWACWGDVSGRKEMSLAQTQVV
jgi:hypothetical protein